MDFRNNLVIVPGKPFQPSLMFVGKARSLTYSRAPERCFTQVKRSQSLWYKTFSYGNSCCSTLRHLPCSRIFVDKESVALEWILLEAPLRYASGYNYCCSFAIRFLPSLILEDKARSLPLECILWRSFTPAGSSVAHQYLQGCKQVAVTDVPA